MANGKWQMANGECQMPNDSAFGIGHLTLSRVLLLSHTTGYQLRAFNDAAEALGIELVFATDRCHKLDDPWQDRAIPVRFHELGASVDAIVARVRQYPVDGVIAVGDRPVVLAAHAAAALNLPWHSIDGAIASTDKRRSRAVLAAAGLPSPRFAVRDARGAIREAGFAMREAGFATFPCVLKPLGLSGSRGVIRANDAGELDAAFGRIRALLARPQVRAARTGLEDQILVEQYIDGREFAVEGVLTGGALQVFAIFDKPDPLEGPFFEETIYVTPSREPAAAQGQIIDHVQRASRALGLSHGPIHAECRVTPEGTVYVLEVAARPIGGLCSRVLTFRGARGAGGAPLEEVLLRHAVGESTADFRREDAAAAVMMIPIRSHGMYKSVEGESEARAVPGVTDIRITAKVGQLLEPLPEAGSYLGFIFARGRTPADVEASVRQAHGKLAFGISADIAVTPLQT
jgi:biotin carboxylase